MSKHLNKKIKYNYVKRFKRGENIKMLANEIILQNNCSSNTKHISRSIRSWVVKYDHGGINELQSKTGLKRGSGKGRPSKKRKINTDNMSRDELIKWINIIEDINDKYEDVIKKNLRPRVKYSIVKYVVSKYGISVREICSYLNVSFSGYYKWVKCPRFGNNYNQKWLNIIKNKYHYHNGIYGAYRLHMYLMYDKTLEISLKTFKRYYRFLKLKSKIRVPKIKREIKDTSTVKRNYINQNFNSYGARRKLFTDVSQIKFQNKVYFISAVIDSLSSEILDLKVGYYNDQFLMRSNIENAIKKVGQKFFLHSDNAAYYRGKTLNTLVSKYRGIQSFSYPGNSLDNRPVEYLFSILKQEYLKFVKPKNLKELDKIIQKAKHHYNFKRRQGNLKWKTPHECRA